MHILRCIFLYKQVAGVAKTLGKPEPLVSKNISTILITQIIEKFIIKPKNKDIQLLDLYTIRGY